MAVRLTPALSLTLMVATVRVRKPRQRKSESEFSFASRVAVNDAQWLRQRGVSDSDASASASRSRSRQSGGDGRCQSDAKVCVIARTGERKRPYIFDDTRRSRLVHACGMSLTADVPSRLRWDYASPDG